MLPVILLLLNVSVYVYLIVLCELLVCMNDWVKLFKTTIIYFVILWANRPIGKFIGPHI